MSAKRDVIAFHLGGALKWLCLLVLDGVFIESMAKCKVRREERVWAPLIDVSDERLLGSVRSN
jgi:hypothetical protein